MKVIPSLSSSQHVLIASGGDDQSMSMYHIQVNLKAGEDGKLLVAREFSTLFNKEGAAGAAMKGSSILDIVSQDGNTFVAKVASVAYDQRFSVWDVRGKIEILKESELQYKELILIPLSQAEGEISSSKEKALLPRLYDAYESMISRVGIVWALDWNCGVITHVMEVSNLSFSLVPTESDDRNTHLDVVVAGQGFQHLKVAL